MDDSVVNQPRLYALAISGGLSWPKITSNDTSW
jgi:hypothetical protein